MFKNSLLHLNVKVALAAMVTLGGCASTQNVELEAQSIRDTPQQSTNIGQYLAGFNFSRLSTIEVSEISSTSVINAEKGSEYYLQEEAILRASDPLINLHEASLPDNASDLEVKTRNFVTRTFKARSYTSVSQNLPAGWRLIEGGVLHENSGMTCVHEINVQESNFTVRLEQVRLFDEISMDVGCDYQVSSGGYITIFASHWPELSQQDHANAAAEQIRTQFKTDKAVAVQSFELDGYDRSILKTPTVIGYEADNPNADSEVKKVKSSLWLVKENGWHVKARATHALDENLTEFFSTLLFTLTHINVYEKDNAAPIGEVEV